MKYDQVSVSFDGLELSSCFDSSDVEVYDPDAPTFAAGMGSATITCEMVLDDCQAFQDAMAEMEWQQRCRRELSPMFDWTPMPVAYIEANGVRIPVEEIGPLQDDGDSVEVTFTVWRHWHLL